MESACSETRSKSAACLAVCPATSQLVSCQGLWEQKAISRKHLHCSCSSCLLLIGHSMPVFSCLVLPPSQYGGSRSEFESSLQAFGAFGHSSGYVTSPKFHHRESVDYLHFGSRCFLIFSECLRLIETYAGPHQFECILRF